MTGARKPDPGSSIMVSREEGGGDGSRGGAGMNQKGGGVTPPPLQGVQPTGALPAHHRHAAGVPQASPQADCNKGNCTPPQRLKTTAPIAVLHISETRTPTQPAHHPPIYAVFMAETHCFAVGGVPSPTRSWFREGTQAFLVWPPKAW